MKRAGLGVALVLAALPIGVGAAPSVIKPPPGWVAETLPKRKADGFYVAAQWLTFGRGREEYVELDRGVSGGLLSQAFAKIYSLLLARRREKILASRPQTLCGGQKGWYFKHIDRYGDFLTEEVLVTSGKSVYISSYSYPSRLKPQPLGERALFSLCPPVSTSNTLADMPVTFAAPAGWLTGNAGNAGYPGWSGIFAYYRQPNLKFSSMILLAAEPAEDTSGTDQQTAKDESARDKAISASERHFSNVSVKTIQAIKLCGHYDGLYLEYTATYSGRPLTTEQVVASGSEVYTATYMRMPKTPESAAAHKALFTLCPR